VEKCRRTKKNSSYRFSGALAKGVTLRRGVQIRRRQSDRRR
jgi:hypothetical protein